MYRSSPTPAVPILTAAALLLGVAAAEGRQSSIVSSQVAISASEAALHLDFSDGEGLNITLSDGVATVNGEALGSYDVGGAADRAWRGLLADVRSLADGPLARELERWRPDPNGAAADLELLRNLNGLLDEAVGGATGQDRQDRNDGPAQPLADLLEIIARDNYAEGLGEALEDIDLGSLDIRLNEDHVVPQGTLVEGGILVAGAGLDIRGRVGADVVVLNGVMNLGEGGRIDGNVYLIESEMERRDGWVQGEVVDVLRRKRIRDRDRVMAEVRRELEQMDRRTGSSPNRNPRGFLERVGRALGGVFEALVSFMFLGFLALALRRFAGSRMDAVARAVECYPARSAGVGFAGGFLIIPVYLLGIVVLAISVAGSPALLLWVPFFPLAVFAAGLAGFLSVGHYVGRRILDQEFQWLPWPDRHNALHVKMVGVGALLAPFAAGSVIRSIPDVGWLGGVVQGLGALACLAAVVLGLGAVIVTRGGTYTASPESPFADDLDSDPWFRKAGTEEEPVPWATSTESGNVGTDGTKEPDAPDTGAK